MLVQMREPVSNSDDPSVPPPAAVWRRFAIAALFAVGLCAVVAAIIIAHADGPAAMLVLAPRAMEIQR